MQIPYEKLHSFPEELIRAVAMTVISFLIYMSNGRYIGAGDCVPASIIPIAVARGDGPWLDRYRAYIEDENGRLPGYCEESRGHVVSRYPIGPGLVLTPFVVPQVWYWDAVNPGWDLEKTSFNLHARRMTKTAASTAVSISIGLLYLWLRSYSGICASLTASIAAAFGSGLWTTASQAGWQHGPAVFCLMISEVCLQFFGHRRWAMISAGIAAGLIVVCRIVNLPISFALWLYVTRKSRNEIIWFTMAAGITGTCWMAWNIWFFDHPNGGYSEIEKMHGWAHGVKGSWATPLMTGLAGTLLSPSHGLIVYSPWVLAALPGIIFLIRSKAKAIDQLQLLSWLSLSLPATLIIYSKYSCWWAGHCFGARFWIDSTPIFAGLLAVTIEQLQFNQIKYKRLLNLIVHIVIAFAMALHLVGALTYPTTWHSSPTNADRDHQRLWDWHDNEITRGLKEGIHARQWSGL